MSAGKGRAQKVKLAPASPRASATLAGEPDLGDELRAAEDSRDRFAALYDFAPIGIATLDESGVIRELNLAGAALLGRERRHAIGIPFSVFLEDRAPFRRHMTACRQGGAPVKTELRLRHRDGSVIPVEILSSRAVTTVASYHTALVDLTDRNEAEEERQRLMAAHRAAQEANEAKDTFIAMLSHELRSPLAPVLAAASLLEGGGIDGDEAATLGAMIVRNVTVQARLIDDLLDVTRISRGKLRLTCEQTDVHAIIRDVMAAIAPELAQRRLRVTVALDAAHFEVSGDTMRLRQVFANLLKNALKFTATGGALSVRSWNHGATLAVEVSDTGVGLEPAQIERLFAPFTQVEVGREGGLGLGLAICRGIVELHGGRITAASPGRGRGARFVVELQSVAAAANAPLPEVLEHPFVAPEPTTSARILVVDDHRDTAEALSLALTAQGYTVRTASSVSRALKVDLSTVDLVISDIGLPGGGGLALVRKLHQRAPVKAIALSGYGTERDVRASKEAGFLAHLTKPVGIPELLDAITKALGVSRRAGRSPARRRALPQR